MAGLNSLMSLLMRFKPQHRLISLKSPGETTVSPGLALNVHKHRPVLVPPTPEKNVANLPLMASYFNLCSTNFMKIVSILEIEVTIYTVHLKILFSLA